MTAANPTRRAIRERIGLLVALLVTFAVFVSPQPLVGAQGVDSPNVLDRPMADLAVLDAPDAATTPMLLVLDAAAPTPSTARITVLRRDDAWRPVTATDIDLGADGLVARWLVGLGEGRFALVASSPQQAPGTGRAVVAGLAIRDEDGSTRIDELGRQAFDRAIEDAGAADVDGFGSAELVLGLRPLSDASSCGASSLAIVDGSIAAVRRSIDVPGPLGAGLLGRFDAVPGAELLVYASAGCPPGGAFETNLLTIHLADGSQTRATDGVLHVFPTTLPPPLLLDLDGSAPDEVIATGEDGLTVFDPSDDWHPSPVAGSGSVALVAGPTGQGALPGARVAIHDAAGAGALVTARLHRDEAGGLVWEGRSELPGSAMDPARWSILTTAIQTAATHQTSSNAWIGDAVDKACPYVLLPGAILPCGTDDLRSGAAWLATHPVAAMPIGGQRVILVAAGLEWRPEAGLPASPTPVAAGPAGWWRHGPSTPFALSEIGSEDFIFLLDSPTPATSIGTTTAKDGTAVLPGFAGTRLFTTITPLADGQDVPVQNANTLAALTSRPGPPGRASVVRIPVASGLGSGRDESVARLALGEVPLNNGRSASRWAVGVVPVNDWGEWGRPVAQTIIRDAVAPTLGVEEPFTSPVWPFVAALPGRSEPGSMVHVDGIGDVEVDRRGRFAIDTQLAPWPQVYRVTATDPAGNVTVGEFTVVGGIDYRRLPWPGVVALGLLAMVAARGLFGGRSRTASVEATPSATALDDASTPTIEELPPGSGLARG